MNWGRALVPAVEAALPALSAAAPRVAVDGAFCKQPLSVTVSAFVWADGGAGARWTPAGAEASGGGVLAGFWPCATSPAVTASAIAATEPDQYLLMHLLLDSRGDASLRATRRPSAGWGWKDERPVPPNAPLQSRDASRGKDRARYRWRLRPGRRGGGHG